MPPSVFISHNRADKPFARTISADLQRSGADVWLDEERIELGDSLQESIQRAIDECDFIAVVLTPESVASNWVRQELRQALERELGDDEVVVLPLLLRDCEIPGFLRDKLYADFRDKDGYTDSLNLIKRRVGLPLTETLDESEKTILAITHNMTSALSILSARLKHLSSRHPDLRRELEPLKAITLNAVRSVRQQAILQAFSLGTYQLRRDRQVRLQETSLRILRDHSILSDPGRKIEWRVEGARKIGTHAVDEGLIEVALASLVDNAFKYSYANTTITVRFAENADEALIHVSNTGLAPTHDANEDIFLRGYRGREAVMVTSTGLGMGLYVARLIVAAHGGELSHRHDHSSSRTTFTISLPKV